MKNDDEKGSPSRLAASRAGRPRRVSTDEIVTVAIELADEVGLVDLSMPKLAKRLGVGTMTLYGYVESKDDLLDRMAARIFAGLVLPDDDDWRQVLFGFFSNFRTAAIAHPTLGQLLPTGRITIPAVFEILERSFQEMADEGLAIEDAVRTFYAALAYTVGFVLWEIPRAQSQPETDYYDQWDGLLAELDSTQFPILKSSAAPIVRTVASVQQFEWGLRKVLAS